MVTFTDTTLTKRPDGERSLSCVDCRFVTDRAHTLPEMASVQALVERIDSISKDSISKGFALGFVSVLVISVICLASGRYFGVREAPETLLRDLAQIGVGLLIAYSVAIAAVERDVSAIEGDHRLWVGFVTSIGCCGLVGVGIAVAVASLGSGGWLVDEVIWWWSVGAIGMLGLLVAFLPFLSYEWRRAARS